MINYIILAHTNPRHLHRLIGRLDDEGVFFYVHIDRQVNIAPFLIEKENVFFLRKRELSTWGSVGITKATVTALDQVLKDRRSGYCVLLSGVDYPIKSNACIKNFFAGQDACFIYATHLPDKMMFMGAMDRITLYKYDISEKRGDYVQLPSVFTSFNVYWWGIIKRLLKKGIIPWAVLKPRRHPKYIKPAAGQTWWALPVEAAERIMDFLKDHPGYLRFHRRSLFPEEMVIQSIVLHLGLKQREHVTYDVWEKRGYQNGTIATENDLPELLSRPELFARKFEQDSPLLDMLDKAHT